MKEGDIASSGSLKSFLSNKIVLSIVLVLVVLTGFILALSGPKDNTQLSPTGNAVLGGSWLCQWSSNFCNCKVVRSCLNIDTYTVRDNTCRSRVVRCAPGQICLNGYCQKNLTNGTVTFVSHPILSATHVYNNANNQFWGNTVFSKSLAPGAYTIKANNGPLYQNYVYNTFTVSPRASILVNITLSQSHHWGCATNNTCIIVPGAGPNTCSNPGGSCGAQNTCFDSDGTYGYTTKGNVSGYLNGVFYINNDWCVNSTTLKEMYCWGPNTYNASYNFNCINATLGYNGCTNGACVQNTNGTALFSSTPLGAQVQDTDYHTWGYTYFTKSFAPGTYTAKAVKHPYYQNPVYKTFTVTSGQVTFVNFTYLNQSHHAECLPANETFYCGVVRGLGPTYCTGC